MKTLENIELNNEKLTIGWIDLSIDKFVHTTTVLISELNEEEQIIISDLKNVIVDRLSETEILIKSLTQITINQHLSEERILYYVTEIPRFLIISSINNSEKIKYNAYKNLCNLLK